MIVTYHGDYESLQIIGNWLLQGKNLRHFKITNELDKILKNIFSKGSLCGIK